MTFNLILCGRNIKSFAVGAEVAELELEIRQIVGINLSEIYFLQNGRKIDKNSALLPLDVYADLRQLGGKGGFGSMLRAIGAQIEKTTNREACRDLSGRRLRDINEEKRLKTWLDSQKNLDQESEDKQRKKIQKLQAKPKHEFKDEAYEQARMELTQNIADSVEEGFKKANAFETSAGSKRAAASTKKKNKKKKIRGALWLDEVSSSSHTDDSDSESDMKNAKIPKSNLKETISSTVTLASITSTEASDSPSIGK